MRRAPLQAVVLIGVASLAESLRTPETARERLSDVAVEPVRAQRAAGHVDDRPRVLQTEAPARRRPRAAAQLRAERVAGEDGALRGQLAPGQREGQRDAAGDAPGDAIGEARHAGLPA